LTSAEQFEAGDRRVNQKVENFSYDVGTNDPDVLFFSCLGSAPRKNWNGVN
jgi:hypothetical protein